MSGNDQLAAYRNSKHTFVILVLLVFLVNTQSDQYDKAFFFSFPSLSAVSLEIPSERLAPPVHYRRNCGSGDRQRMVPVQLHDRS